jgi:A/G-specific adenine glycosylase
MDWPALRRSLSVWFAAHARDLPWRKRPTPYRVWISEIMLQQTRVEAVKDAYARFLRRFPTLKALREAELDEVLELWSGLGYYRRARMLHAASRQVTRLPGTVKELQALPGIGRYTAGAIVSLAHNRPAPIVDGNIERVFARWLALSGDIKSADNGKRLWRLADDWVTHGHHEGHEPRVLNQALMELGAVVCTPVNPRCDACPASTRCAAARTDNPAQWPHMPARKPRRAVRYRAFAVLDDQGRVLMLRRPEADRQSLLPAGLWELPHGEAAPDWLLPEPNAAGEVRHAIMDNNLQVTVHRAKANGDPPAEAQWFKPEAARKAAIASITRKLLEAVFG